MVQKCILVGLGISLLFASLPRPGEASTVSLTLPDIDWAIQMELEGFQVDFQEFLPNLKGRSFQAHDSVSGLIVSVHIDPAPNDGQAVDYRDTWWENLKGQLDAEVKDVKLYERNGAAYIEFVENMPGMWSGLNLKNVMSCIVKDDLWIGIHLSKGEFKPEDQGLFDGFLETIRVVEDYSPASIDFFVFGSQCYRNSDYGKAAKYYQLALDLERVERLLPETYWLVLVDNLAMAYGIPGQVDKAIEVLEYGLSLRPNYPMFYYNLACAYAESDNLEQTVANLARAYEHRENMTPGEELPDPMKDPSFKHYRENERFLELSGSFSIPSSAVEFNLTLPDLDWALQVSLDDFELDFDRFNEDLEGRTFQARNLANGLVVSVFIAKELKGGGLGKLREYIWESVQRRAFGDTLLNVNQYERDSAGYLDYVRPTSANMQGGGERNLWLMMVKDKIWITLHLSLLDSRSHAVTLFEDFLEDVKIMDDYTPSSMEYFKFGSHFYLREKYKKAAPCYQQALDMEKRERSLPEPFWLVLTDNLGMSYGLEGKLDEAQVVFEYGLSVRPEYPMFHYNLACNYAEQRNLDQALHYLNLAYTYKDNMIEGENLPDPMKDPSFKRYRGKVKFRGLIDKWEN